MTLATFDTLKFANRLKSAGVPHAHAEAEAEVLSDMFAIHLEHFVTQEDLWTTQECLKREIGDVRKNMELLRKEMDCNFSAVQQEFKNIRQESRSEFKNVYQEFNTIRQEMKQLGLRLTVRLGGMVVASTAFISALPLLTGWLNATH